MTRVIALATIAIDRMAGGLEKNIVYLANYLASCGDTVLLLTFDRPGANSFYKLDPRIEWQCLGATAPHGRISFWQRGLLLWNIRKTLTAKKASHIVCFHHGIFLRFLVSSVLLGVKRICSERNSLTLYRHVRAKKWNSNFASLFFSDAITVQFPSYIKQYPSLIQKNIKVVHNPVFPIEHTEAVPRQPVILSVGRLATQKRFDLLIEAFQKIASNWPEWRLVLIGDGPLQSELESIIKKLNLSGKVDILPVSNQLTAHYQSARIYCQPSQWEGFPNAMAEAMAAGAIPIGFEATSGVADLIEDGVNGILVREQPSAEALARGLEAALRAQSEWDRYSSNAQQITQRYSPESWKTAWEKVLASD